MAVYGGFLISNYRGQKLLKLQDKIVNNIFKTFFTHSDNLYKSMNILKLPDVYRLRVGLLMYRTIISNECPTILNNLVLTYPEHDYGTRSCNMLIPPFPRVEAIRTNFQYQFIDVWNKIPNDIKLKPTASTFKKALFQYLINNY